MFHCLWALIFDVGNISGYINEVDIVMILFVIVRTGNWP